MFTFAGKRMERRHESLPGPGQYDPKGPEDKKLVPVMAQQSAKRSSLKKDNHPGPGI